MPRIIQKNLGKSNSYLIKSDTGYILLDAGVKNNSNKIQAVMSENNANIGDINLIIITHVHTDHVGSLAELSSATGAEILVHANGAEALQKGKTSFPKGTSWFFKFISALANSFVGPSGKFDPVHPDILIEEDYKLNEFGVEGKVIPTPGHTQDSSSVIIGDKHCLCGDTMFNLFPNSVYPVFANNKEMLLQSWQKLKRLDCDYFYPGHGDTFEKEKFLQTYEAYLGSGEM